MKNTFNFVIFLISFCYVSLFIFNFSFVSSSILINEVMPNNYSNSSGDWVELYNSEDYSINLTYWYIRDIANNSKNISMNTIIYEKDFFVIYFSNKLNNDGDEIFLYNQDNQLIDSILYPIITQNYSYARCPDGENNLLETMPTPNFMNNCSLNTQNNESNQTNQTYSPFFSFNYPEMVYNNQTNFTIFIDLYNFSKGLYDLKIDIKNETKYLNRFWTLDGWSDKNSWVENFTNLDSSYENLEIKNIIDVSDFFIGNASIQIKIRNLTNEYYSKIENITILNGTFSMDNSTIIFDSESFLEILEYPSNIEFGEEIDVSFHVYKGDTSKYAVYAYVENEDQEKVSDKITVHAGNSSSSSKFQDYYFDITLKLDCLNESGKYFLVLEGLDELEKKKVEIDSCKSFTYSNSKEDYSIQVVEEGIIGEKIYSKIVIYNNEDYEKTFSIWSYIYRASKCYSCILDREENKQIVFIEPNSFKEIILENIVNEAEEGEYNLKIKVIKDELKTPKEFTYPIILSESLIYQSDNLEEIKLTGMLGQSNNLQTNIQIDTINSFLLQSLPYFLSTFAMLFCIYLVIKKI